MRAVRIDAPLTPFFFTFIGIYLLFETIHSRNANLIADMASLATGCGSCLHAKDKIMEYLQFTVYTPSV